MAKHDFGSSTEDLAVKMNKIKETLAKELDTLTTDVQLDETELRLLKVFKTHPLPLCDVLGINIVDLQMAHKFKKYGLINLLHDHYELTIYGDSFLDEELDRLGESSLC